MVIDNHDDQPRPSADRSALSRRLFLQVSAVGVSAGLVAGCSSAGSSGRAEAEIPDWTAADIPAQHGRRVLVTGGNGYPEDDRSGLGYQDALALARAGADVTIASRNQARGEEAVRRIRADAPGSKVRFERLDLSNLTSVRAFGARMRASGQGLDMLINNAGVMGRFHRRVSVDGFERVFATNTLGHFALTALLLPVLRKGREPRVVWVSSMRMSDALPFDDLQLERNYDYAAAYDNSKLANLLLAFELERRSKASGWGVSSLASHPGVARTNLIPDGPGLNSREGWRFRMLPFLFQPAAQGALAILYAATSPQAMAGGYYGPKGFQGLRGLPGVASVPAAAQDRWSAATLWASLERLGQVSFG
ncbi:oxidoreductase [Mesorhizobium sp. STM 4661]|uniref:oxidoreductase n=1 Tax=Mesorhizobium sp. STM 4661 TaxID=1297570 RepID=UPI000688BE24|nr:oxidoreductase [Mesorhizobium sp. STM 4661]